VSRRAATVRTSNEPERAKLRSVISKPPVISLRVFFEKSMKPT
jgi:hypothetical protein